MRLGFVILLALIITTIGLSGCGNGINEYLGNTQEIVENFLATTYEVRAMYYDADLTLPQFTRESARYQSQYATYLQEFEQVSHPVEAVKYRDLVIDGTNASIAELGAFEDAATTLDPKYFDAANVNYSESERSLLPASSEWEKLDDKAEGGNGFQWWYIPVGLFLAPATVGLILYGATFIVVGVYSIIVGSIKRIAGHG